ncbi:hypothetical protein QTO34_016020 [Cnephaeus nilssonii]|uniref:Uncharacterized protein n=1 Tax=Cnephaeus nilssonii TaxID=3371016 RepID=A0AA40I688_CNENI|nr:hypothetical protein QTO34_016020 [Eptesicus nilssonii]
MEKQKSLFLYFSMGKLPGPDFLTASVLTGDLGVQLQDQQVCANVCVLPEDQQDGASVCPANMGQSPGPGPVLGWEALGSAQLLQVLFLQPELLAHIKKPWQGTEKEVWLGVGAWPWAVAFGSAAPNIPAKDRRSRPPVGFLRSVQAPRWCPRPGKPLPEAFPALGSATPQRPCNGFLVGVVGGHGLGVAKSQWPSQAKMLVTWSLRTRGYKTQAPTVLVLIAYIYTRNHMANR